MDYISLLAGKNKLKTEQILAEPPHGLLVSAPMGYGANALSAQIAGLINHNFLEIVAESTGRSLPKITVSKIRSVVASSAIKNDKRRVILITDADLMTRAAQNAFLKALEEPSSRVTFILSTGDESKLLGTVKSRLESLKLDRISSEASKKLLEAYKLSDTSLKQALFLADGLPKTLIELATSDDLVNKRKTTISDTKILLSGSLYQKLLIINKYKDNRDNAINLIDDCLIILKSLITTQTNSSTLITIEKMLDARSKIVSNGNMRLILMQIVLQ